MTTLSVPSRELASRISREVDFNDRLIGSNLHERAGVKTISLYSLHELYILLNKPYPQIDLHKTESWIRTVIRDEELAAQIKTITDQTGSDLEKLLHIRELIGVRLSQLGDLRALDPPEMVEFLTQAPRTCRGDVLGARPARGFPASHYVKSVFAADLCSTSLNVGGCPCSFASKSVRLIDPLAD